jgi:hypothetical protein
MNPECSTTWAWVNHLGEAVGRPNLADQYHDLWFITDRKVHRIYEMLEGA